MGESENTDFVYDPLTDSVSLKRKHTWIRGASSTVRSTVEGRPSGEPDPELGVGGTPAKAAAAQSGYTSLVSLLVHDKEFMIWRRFAFLHSQILLHQQDDLMRLERELGGESDHYHFQEHSQSSAFSNDWFNFCENIKEKLSAYSK